MSIWLAYKYRNVTIQELENYTRLHNIDTGWLFEHREWQGRLFDAIMDDTEIHHFDNETILFNTILGCSHSKPLDMRLKVFHPLCKKKIRIKMTGSRAGDFVEANNQVTGCQDGYDYQLGANYIWHHVEGIENYIDYNKTQYTFCYMELLHEDCHRRVPHCGAVQQYQNLYNVEYR